MLSRAGSNWSRDNAPRLGAALAYYTLFSLAPLLIIVIGVAGLAFGRDAAQGHVVTEMRGLLGDSGAQALQGMIEHSRRSENGAFAAVAAFLTLFLGASGAFVELKGALNEVWDVAPDQRPRGVGGFVKERLASFAMVLVVAFLLLVSLLANAALAASGGALSRFVPEFGAFTQVATALSSLVMTACLFALMFKFLPDRAIAWKDVWAGAALTALLFAMGRHLIGLYLGRSSFASVYGAAGSIVVLVVWVYYAAQIFLLGAELTQAWSGRPRVERHEGIALASGPL